MPAPGRSALALIALMLAAPLRAPAQLPRPLSLDMNIGPGHLLGGPEVVSRGSIAADALLAMRRATGRSSGLLTGISVGLQGPPPSGDKCVLNQTGQCLPSYPLFTSIGVLAGWASAAGSVRVLGGIASVQVEKDNGADRRDYTVGLPVRVESVLARFSHLAAVASVRVTVLPRYRGNAYALLASGVGFRIH